MNMKKPRMVRTELGAWRLLLKLWQSSDDEFVRLTDCNPANTCIPKLRSMVGMCWGLAALFDPGLLSDGAFSSAMTTIRTEMDARKIVTYLFPLGDHDSRIAFMEKQIKRLSKKARKA